MNIDWKSEIAAIITLQSRLVEVDTLVPHYPPEPPATETQIQEVERHLGFRLDLQYREFLQCDNGWKGFLMNAELFGTQDLLGQTELMQHALRHLEVYTQILRKTVVTIIPKKP
jgi:hypothetical protein